MRIIYTLTFVLLSSIGWSQVVSGSYGNKKVFITKIDASTVFVRVSMAAHDPNHCVDSDQIGLILKEDKGNLYTGFIYSDGDPKMLDGKTEISISFVSKSLVVKSLFERKECLWDGKYLLDKK